MVKRCTCTNYLIIKESEYGDRYVPNSEKCLRGEECCNVNECPAKIFHSDSDIRNAYMEIYGENDCVDLAHFMRFVLDAKAKLPIIVD